MKKRNVILAAAGIYIGIAGGMQPLYAAEPEEQEVENYEAAQPERFESNISSVQDNTETDILSEQKSTGLDSNPVLENSEEYSESMGETEETDPVLDGWRDIDGQRYYFVNNEKVTGEKKIGQYWYFFDLETGAMKTGLQMVGSRVLYYADSGEMLKGEQIIDGKEYYFSYTNGARQSGLFSDNTGIMKYYLPEGGLASGEISHEGSWYYFDEETYEMVTGHKEVGKRHLYYSETGQMVKGEVKIGGK